MNKSKLYFQTATAAFFLTFATGLGFFVSLILLFLIRSEEKVLSLNLSENSTESEKRNLKMAKKFSQINIIINLIILLLTILLIYLPGVSFTH